MVIVLVGEVEVLAMGRGNGGTTFSMCLKLLNHAPKNRENGKYHGRYVLPQ